MYEQQASTSSGIAMIFLILLFLVVGGFAVRRSDENKRASKAKHFEASRMKNNPRLALTDTYTYLIKRSRFPGRSYAKDYLKIGIGVEDRVRIQLNEPETSLIRLYKFSNRQDAFKVEQQVIRKWNTKIRGEISTWHTNPGSEFIIFNERHLKQAIAILEDSIGERVDESPEFNSEPTITAVALDSSDQTNTKKPDVLRRTQIYLMQSHIDGLIKVGIGNFDRPDNLKTSNWKIQRFGFFKNREFARVAEKKVLNYWRNELNQQAPERAKKILRSGHTETVEDVVGYASAWNIITKCEGFIPNLSDSDLQIYEQYRDLLGKGKALWKDELGWNKVDNAFLVMKYTYISNMFYYDKKGYTGLSKQEVRDLNKEMYKYLKEFSKFMDNNKQTLERVEKMHRWLPKE